MSSDSAVSAFVASHPRLSGALLGVTLLLLQAGSALAGETGTVTGP